MGQVRAIGFALAASFVASGPAVAPLAAPSLAATGRCAERAPRAIELACAPAIALEPSLLAPDPFALAPLVAQVAPPRAGERLAIGQSAPVPKPTPLLALLIGLGGVALRRRAAAIAQSG